MKIIQSYWSKPLLKNRTDNKPGGWLNNSYLYMSQALSCLKYGEFYPVELVTDRKGKEILIDILELPYSKVDVELDQLNSYPADLWAIGKLYAYRMQEEPFIHVDNDCFIWQRFPEKIENGGLVVERLELPRGKQTEAYHTFMEQLSYIPEEIKAYRKTTTDFIQVNAGIFGGKDLSFLKAFTTDAFRFIDRNLPVLEERRKLSHMGLFNMIYEQYFFHVLTAKRNKQVVHLKTDSPDITNISLAPFANKYVHLFGVVKSYPVYCMQLAERLWMEYPEYYNRIMKAMEQYHI